MSPSQKLSVRSTGSIRPSGASRAAGFLVALVRLNFTVPSGPSTRRLDATRSTVAAPLVVSQFGGGLRFRSDSARSINSTSSSKLQMWSDTFAFNAGGIRSVWCRVTKL